jgi:hypothetical protein
MWMSAINNIAEQHACEVTTGRRFRFGRNWARFLRRLNPVRIVEAEHNLKEFLREESRSGKSFLVIGSGSGLSSLAARRLGAIVASFDFDSQSVACTEELRCRYSPGDESWRVEQGSVLDKEYLAIGSIRHRLLMGRLASHGRDVGSDGER